MPTRTVVRSGALPDAALVVPAAFVRALRPHLRSYSGCFRLERSADLHHRGGQAGSHAPVPGGARPA
jgi:hypothetical protein